MKNLLGKKAKDKITGFEGILTAKCSYLTGCDQYGITPPVDKDGKRQEVQWFDEGRIEVIGDGFTPESVKADNNGCDNNEHP